MNSFLEINELWGSEFCDFYIVLGVFVSNIVRAAESQN